MSLTLFDPITITLPKERIYSRLGYAKNVTKIAPAQRDTYEKYIQKAADIVDLKGVALRTAIEKIEPSNVALSKGLVLRSKSLAEFLNGCREALFMGATAGNEVIQYIRNHSSGKDVTASVVFDAVASEMVDEALSWIVDYFNNQLRREGKRLTSRRFSPGYGDLLLKNQKIIFDTLNFKQLGVTITSDFILIPEKSVIAITGIKDC